ncbi:uncharacterized protein LOC132462411 isoform X1 [Gadus macrocephalus]|uniref:uncharacterized protein LOC132462411 isoform X1 n=1 Tax=Gadus macrocephalus TaxID=80720 RepID=UPI0028CBAC72|nr:uncharacterized protein LOC132462411 isoform X1 [Gadus macrocephalus]
MEEAAVQGEKIEPVPEVKSDGGKAGWMNERSLSSILKHSCLLCWSSSPRDTGVVETDERVLAKTAEIRVRRPQHLALELENAVALESLELQEQQQDVRDLEETLLKLDQHKEKLQLQIKSTRQLCVEESQKILSLQAEESKKEGQVEEYERELARARWRLKKLREEVKNAKRRAEEAGQRNNPLQDSIRQSYEEILQEENALCSLSGGAATPDSQLDESTSPADTTEDDPLPLRPWGRSQSLPAYADFIMRTSSSSFNNNLTGTREEVAESSLEAPKTEGAEGGPEQTQRSTDAEKKTNNEKEALTASANPVDQLDFYKPDPFVHGQAEDDLFNEDMFPKTDSSDVFASDPFKGTDPFAADIFFPPGSDEAAAAAVANDDADTSLSCVEHKASTGTQCFESEFPDEDSDIEISYSREDLDAVAMAADATDRAAPAEARGFKPIQSSSEDLGLDAASRGWRSQGQYSVESDPNGYELDLAAVSPPSDIEELSLASLTGDAAGGKNNTAAVKGLSTDSAQYSPELAPSGAVPDASDMTQLVITEQPLSCEVTSCLEAQPLESETDNSFEVEPQLTLVHHDSVDAPNPSTQITSEMNECSFEMSYPSTHSSFDPYGFKLSPEHSTHSLLDPDDEEDLSPESNDPDLAFDPEPTSSQLNFDRYGFDLSVSRVASEDVVDPYGFKLSQEEENQEVLEVCSHDDQEEVELCSFTNEELVEPYSNQEVVDPFAQDNQEVLEPCNQNNQEMLDFCSNGNQEILEPSVSDTKNVLDLFSIQNQELVDLSSPLNQEVLEPFCDDNQEPMVSHDKDEQELPQQCNQEVVETSIHNKEPRAPSYYENQEVLDFCGQDNQELQGFSRNQELQDYRSHDNQEVLDFLSNQALPEANNNHHCEQDSEMYFNPDTQSNISNSTDPANSSAGGPASEVSNSPEALHLEGLDLGNTTGSTNNCNTYKADLLSMSVDQEQATSNMSTNSDPATFNVSSGQNLLQGDLGSVFSAGGYIGCDDVADDLEPLHHRQGNPVAEPVEPMEPVRPVQPVRPVRPMRPPRPSLLAKEKAQSQTQGVDLK